jgi:ABC-type transport system substrate-binding protein
MHRHAHLGRKIIAIACASALTLSATACGSDSNKDAGAQGGGDLDAETATPGGSITVGVPAETDGWNPAVARWADAGSYVGTSVLEPLFFFDGDANTQPLLAESATPADDYMSWSIKIRPNISFSDGTTLDAPAVKASLDANLTDPASLSSVVLSPLVNDVEVVDDTTVKVNLKVAWASFITNLASSSGLVMAPAMLAAEDKGASKPIGTGPFVFEAWSRDDEFIAKRNPNYWRKDAAGVQLPYLDGITFKVMTDDATRANALETGDIDMMLATSAEVASRFVDKTDYRVLKDYETEKTFVMLQTEEIVQGEPNPLANIHARRALAYGTDRKAAAALIGSDVGITTSPLTTTSPWGLPEGETNYPDFDEAKARAEIEAYKQDTGASELSFTLVGNNKPEEIRLLQALAAQWSTLGITASLSNIEQTQFLMPLVAGNFQAAIFRNGAWPDPDAMNYFYNSANIGEFISVNFSHLDNPTVDEALNTGRASSDRAVRKEAYDRFVKALNDVAVNIWLYNTPYSLITRADVRGLAPFQQQGIGGYVPKPYWDQVWRKR